MSLNVTRGRNKTVSDNRLLLEVLLHQDRAVYTGELASQVPLDRESVRQRMNQLDEDGLVEKTRLSAHNVYRLTAAGHEQVAQAARKAIQ